MLQVNKRASLEPKNEAFPHQLHAFQTAKDLPYVAVFHEQGLGKTKIGLDLGLFWLARDVVDSVLIVTKKSLIANWKTEISAHSYLKPRIIGQDRTSNFYAFNSPVALYLCHYEAILSECKRLRLFLKTRRVGVVLDEAHKIKNPATRVTRALHELASDFERRIIMTGTPIANRPFDLWSQIHFLDGGEALGDNFKEFKKDLDLSNELGNNSTCDETFVSNLSLLFEKIRPFSIRETKDSAGLNLPDKTVRNLECVLEPVQAELYNQFRMEMAASVVQNGKLVLDDAEVILKRLLRLVQVASNPAIVDQSYTGKPGKLSRLETLVQKTVDDNEKIVVWTSFIKNADYLGQKLSEYGTQIVHGGLGLSVREDSLSAFRNEKMCRVLIATPGAAKEGLTLTMANHAVFFDRSFSLDDYLQAQDRIHRISQDRACYITNLVAAQTIDVWVDSLLSAKNLAAQLGQGDIEKDEYNAKVDYSFSAILSEILETEVE